MRELYGNIFDIHCDALCITTNGFRKKNGEAVMGRGIALDIQKYYPDIPKALGSHLGAHWNVPGILYPRTGNKPAIISFPVKPDKFVFDGDNAVSHYKGAVGSIAPGFFSKANIGLILTSAEKLKKLTIQNDWKKVLIPRPGAEELSWKEVKPELDKILDDRFYAVTYSRDPHQYFTGIGSRKTPKGVLDLMGRVSTFINSKGYILRSGGAGGADTAFADALPKPRQKRIYIPWKGFNNIWEYESCTVDDRAIEIAKTVINPSHWNNLPMKYRKLHARNVYQVFGHTPKSIHSEFIICWTPNGKPVGGTATAIKLAEAWGIPVYNLGDPETLKRVTRWVESV